MFRGYKTLRTCGVYRINAIPRPKYRKALSLQQCIVLTLVRDVLNCGSSRNVSATGRADNEDRASAVAPGFSAQPHGRPPATVVDVLQHEAAVITI